VATYIGGDSCIIYLSVYFLPREENRQEINEEMEESVCNETGYSTFLNGSRLVRESIRV